MEALKKAGYEYVRIEKSTREADYTLKQVGSDKGFEWKGQEDYDRLGEAVTEYLYEQLEGKYGCKRLNLGTGEDEVPVFVKNLNAPTILVLIQGSGAVTPGMWARSLCINESLHEGTIFPYIASADERDWGVVVANPNTEGEGNECSELHVKKLLDKVVMPSPAKNIVLVAHSYGGWSTLYYLKTSDEATHDRIKVVAFTDSVHKLKMTIPTEADIKKVEKPEMRKKMRAKKEAREELKEMVPEAFEAPSEQVLKFLEAKCCNWVMSSEPLNTPLPAQHGVKCVSAGHPEHVWTSGVAYPKVFEYLDSFFPLREQSTKDKIKSATELKESGNAFLRNGEHKKASFDYKKAKVYLKGIVGDGEGGDQVGQIADNFMKKSGKVQKKSEEEVKEARELNLVINNNLAQARLKLQDWQGAVQYATEVLSVDPENTKAMFRRGQAYLALGDLDGAKGDLEAVQKVDPKSVASALQELKLAYKKLADKEKKAYAGMFN
eukprot:TRINITY_DN4330_c0_g1_i2.p1 TRINITY_DN4330_c0_g1~~TRINITY_DN4330_c0_g1_i2.p1  ORF type:complete len:492 (+),score=178.40 TRINITY_DN4330_c0_g1_i2:1142-2617(+)